ncbi:MAG: TrkA family potassium uptake protein [Candidatus Omnitrophota bacterium]
MKQFAVLGLGRLGSTVAMTLGQQGYQVLAIDIKKEPVQQISEFVTQAVQLDATDEKALRAVGMGNVGAAVVSTGSNLEASILITLILKEIGVKQIIAKGVSEEHSRVLEKVGATKVVFPERDMGIRIAKNLISPQIIEHIGLSDKFSILEITAPKEFIDKSLGKLDARAKYGINIIAIKRKPVSEKTGEETEEKELDECAINALPQADDIIKEGDILVVVGSNESIEKLKKF